MANFLEELYYGNVDPQARGYRKGSHKVKNPMEWVRRMNNIRERVNEVVNAEMIFT